MRFRDLKIGARMWLVTIMGIGILLVMVFIGYPRLMRLQEAFESLKEEILERDMIMNLELALGRNLMPVNDYLIAGGDPDEKANFEETTKEVEERFNQLQPHSLNLPDEAEAFLSAKKNYLDLKQISLRIFAIPQEQAYGLAQAGHLMEEVDSLADKAISAIKKFREISNKEIIEEGEKFLHAQQEIIAFSLILILLLIFSALVIAAVFVLSITKPVKSLLEATQRITHGDLSARAKEESKDEIGELGALFNKMAESLSISRNESVEWSKNLEAKVRERTKELEQAYKKLQELQDSLIQAEKFNAVGRLASGVAHEVKNPLGIIKQGAEYLEGKLLPSEKDAPGALRMIQDNIKRADTIIRALLDFSRVSKLEKKPEDINSILESSLSLIQHSPMLENIKIIRELGKGLPDVLVDKGRMEQVFINVLLNAVQAMPGGGNLFLRTYQSGLNGLKDSMDVSGENYFKPGEEVLMIEIEDTGAGITGEDLKKVFDPFFTTKEPGQGTGLGLSVSKNILAMHKGLIEIQSIEGKGAKVIITLKIAGGGGNG